MLWIDLCQSMLCVHGLWLDKIKMGKWVVYYLWTKITQFTMMSTFIYINQMLLMTHGWHIHASDHTWMAYPCFWSVSDIIDGEWYNGPILNLWKTAAYNWDVMKWTLMISAKWNEWNVMKYDLIEKRIKVLRLCQCVFVVLKIVKCKHEEIFIDLFYFSAIFAMVYITKMAQIMWRQNILHVFASLQVHNQSHSFW